MSIAVWRAVGAGVAFAVILLSGVALDHSGRPYGTAMVTVHKLVALAVGVLLLMALHGANKAGTLGAIPLIVGLVTGLLLLATGVIGALLTLEKPMPAALATVHQVAAYLTTLAAGASIYLLVVRK